jgi:hypothetical protein
MGFCRIRDNLVSLEIFWIKLNDRLAGKPVSINSCINEPI